jgi:hypothetical protein
MREDYTTIDQDAEKLMVDLKEIYCLLLETGFDVHTARLEIWRVTYDQVKQLRLNHYGNRKFDTHVLPLARQVYSKTIGEIE